MKNSFDTYDRPFEHLISELDHLDHYVARFKNKFENKFVGSRIRPSSKPPYEYHILKDVLTEKDKIDFRIEKFDSYVVLSFATLIKNSINLVKDGINSCIGSYSKKNIYQEQILVQLRTIDQKAHTISYDGLKLELISMIKSVERLFSNYNGKSEPISTSDFQLREQYDLNTLQTFALIAKDVGIISEDHSEEAFVNVFMYQDTEDKISFSSITPNAVMFIEEIAFAFENLRPRSIARSACFLTKQGIPLKVSNYTTAKKRIKSDSFISRSLINKLNLHFPDR